MLSQYLAAELQRQGATTYSTANTCQHNLSDTPLASQEAARLLARLDALSDEEVERLLDDLSAIPGKAV
jgi:hypothetical protein